jgi:hypothetical protein
MKIKVGKDILKKVSILLVSIFMVAIISKPLHIMAESDTIVLEEEVEERSPLAIEFDSKWAYYLEKYGTTVVATLTMALALIAKIKQIKNATESTGKEISKANELASNNNKEFKNFMLEARADLSNISRQNNAINEEIKKELEKSREEIIALKQENSKIKDALLIGFMNDKELVRKGYANQIAKVVNGDEKNN